MTFKPFIAALCCAAMGTIALSQSATAQTGSRVGAQGMPLQTIWLEEPNEIKQILRLLQNDEAPKAIEVAEKFLETKLPADLEYSGLNALCVARVANSEPDRAIEQCNKAIALKSTSWQAYNSRGTAHYVKGDFDKALEDYQTALELNPESEIIKHNIKLTNAKRQQS